MAVTKQVGDSRVALSLRSLLEDGPDGAAGAKKSFQPYHAKSVPRFENLEAASTESAFVGKAVTTMMLRNIPNKYTQNTLLQEIGEQGFVGTFDFFYLPMDVHNRSNVGYAFINFVAPRDAERFRRKFSEHRFQRFQSRKISSVCPAHVQGLDANLRHFENRAVTHSKNGQYRPIVLQGNRRLDFDEALLDAKARADQSAARTTHGEQIPRHNSPFQSVGNPAPSSPSHGGAKMGACLEWDKVLRGASRGAVGADVGADVTYGSSCLGTQLGHDVSAGQRELGCPAYVPLPASWIGGAVYSLFEPDRISLGEWRQESERVTPRTNSIFLGGDLDRAAKDKVWSML